jgi:hypothetical protein
MGGFVDEDPFVEERHVGSLRADPGKRAVAGELRLRMPS